MTSDLGSARDSAIDGPYVGLRPFRAEHHHLIFGRDRDAQLLRQKIFSSRLTLLYAPSGVGKTSLLAALVIPSLEAARDGDEGARVVSFEQWQTADPLSVLKQRIANVQGAAVAQDAHLADVLVAAQAACRRSIVVVLDQFEQLLIRHPQLLDAIGGELGATIQLAEHCHIVVSLREEFLASLHPLRRHIPMLMSSTYRLEHLSGDAAERAITEPAAKFSATVEETLVKTLVSDLQADTSVAAGQMTVPRPGAVELPFLQLVCKTLWEHSDRRRLTLDLYSVTLGGRRGIIQLYLDTVLAGLTPAQRDDAAQLLHRLAPQSGVKKLYVADELAAETGLRPEVTSALLDHFERHSVLRMRDTGRAPGYELHHDAFTSVLRPWIDARLLSAARRARRWRRVKIGAAAATVLAVAVAFAWPMLRARARVNSSVAEARASFEGGQETAATAEWNDLAGFLVGQDKVSELLRLLHDNRDAVPGSGDVDDIAEALPEAVGLGELNPPSGADEVTVAVSPERSLDAVAFYYTWRVGASRVLARRGLPVPIKVRVATDDQLDISQIEIRRTTANQPQGSALPSRSAERPLRLTVRSRPDRLILLSENLQSERTRAALEALRRLDAAFVESLEASNPDESGVYVPSWTAPTWRALGVQAWPEEFGIPLALSARVVAEPEVFLDNATVQFLLDRARTRFCETVAEAESARGGVAGIRRDLIAMVRAGYSIGDLPDLLDALAAFPAGRASATVVQAFAEAQWPARTPAGTLSRAKPIARTTVCGSEPTVPTVPDRLRDLLFPPLETEVQVTLGDDLLKTFQQGSANQKQFHQIVTDIRQRIYGQLGVVAPAATVRRAGRALGSRQFSVVLPGRGGEAATGPVASGGDVIAAIKPALERVMSDGVLSFVKAEAVAAALDEVPPAVGSWLRQTYSLTEIKMLLRSVLGGPTATSRAPERSVAQSPWLLGSLAFWTASCPSRNEECLVTGLLSTQRARLTAAQESATPAGGNTLTNDVGIGIRHLVEGSMSDADRSFKAALKRDSRAASDTFARQWAQWARRIQGYQLTNVMKTGVAAACEAPRVDAATGRPVSLRTAWEIEDHLDARQPGPSDTEPLTLQLCLFRAHVANRDTARSESAWQRVTRESPDPSSWPVAAQYVAGRELFDAVRTQVIDDGYLADSARLLSAAMVRLPDAGGSGADRVSLFQSLVGVCDNEWRAPRCRTHLAAVSEAVPDSFWIPWLLSSLYSSLDTTWAEQSLPWIDKSEANFPRKGLSSEEQARLRAWILFFRLNAHSELARRGAEHGKITRDLYQTLLAAVPHPPRPGWPTRGDVHSALFYLSVFEGNLENAQRILERWGAESKDGTLYQSAEAFLRFERADTAGLKEFARKVAGDTEADTEPYYHFVASLAAILSNTLEPATEAMIRRLINSDYQDRDFARLLYSWRLETEGRSEAAKALISARWNDLDQDSWTRRLDRGEIEVWGEMMIDYYHQPTPAARERLFQWLKDETAFRDTPLARTGNSFDAFVTEAHFYDGIFQAIHGDGATRASRMKAALERVVALREVTKWEYYMARYLLGAARATQ